MRKLDLKRTKELLNKVAAISLRECMKIIGVGRLSEPVLLLKKAIMLLNNVINIISL